MSPSIRPAYTSHPRHQGGWRRPLSRGRGIPCRESGHGLRSFAPAKHAESAVRWRMDQEAGGFGGCQGCRAGPAKTGCAGIIRLTFGAFHGPPTLMPSGLRIAPSGREIQLRKRKARLEGLEPPTRCLEGSWAPSLIDATRPIRRPSTEAPTRPTPPPASIPGKRPSPSSGSI